MDIKKLQTLVVDALEDIKGQEIKVYDTTHLTSLFDRICIVSGTSNRQTKALAASVRDKVKGAGGDIISMEGEDTGEWVLVDLGDMIVHIMQPAIRAYYRLEEIWGDKEVKFGAAKRVATSTKALASGEAAPAKKVSRHLAAKAGAADEGAEPKKPAARKVAAKKTATKTATKTASKTAAKKTAAKTPVGKTVKVAATKSATAARKTAAKRPAAKKAG